MTYKEIFPQKTPSTPDRLIRMNDEKRLHHDCVLSDVDKEVLTLGFAALQHQLESIPFLELPGTILLPDTGVRPLIYGIKLVVEDVYKRRNAPFPQYRFIVPTSASMGRKHEDIQKRREEMEKIRAEVASIERLIVKIETTMKENRQTIELPGSQEEREREQRLLIRANPMRLPVKTRGDLRALRDASLLALEEKNTLEQTLEGFAFFEQRLIDICNERKDAKILVIDDYISKGTTMESINIALMRQRKSLPRWFAFFLNDCGEENMRFPEGNTVNFSVGARASQERFAGYLGFDYRDTFAWNESTHRELARKKESSIGVRKDSSRKTTIRSPHADPGLMQNLRKDVGDVARQFLKILN